ncbi:MAG: dehydratase [Propionibacteriales bacterium]|nr:dehydratase [Propionibacteriales bacterium]
MTTEPSANRVGADRVEKGSELPSRTHRFTRADLVRYAGASGDFNPIHWSDRVASAMGLPGVIVHGMFTMGVAVGMVSDWAGGPDRVISCRTRFTKPIVVPDDAEGVEISITGRVTAVDGPHVTVAVDVRCDDDKVLGATVVEVRRG